MAGFFFFLGGGGVVVSPGCGVVITMTVSVGAGEAVSGVWLDSQRRMSSNTRSISAMTASRMAVPLIIEREGRFIGM